MYAIRSYYALRNQGGEMAGLARTYLGPSVRKPFALLLYFMLMLLVSYNFV